MLIICNIFLYVATQKWLKMDFRKGSKTLSCESLARGQSWMDRQGQPGQGAPPVEARFLYTICVLKLIFPKHPQTNDFGFTYAQVFFYVRVLATKKHLCI